MTSHKYNNRTWSAYNSNTKPDGPKQPESPELEKLLTRHPSASHFFKEGKYNIRLLTCSMLSPVNAIDVTGYNEDGTPTHTTEDLINLLMTHSTDQGVLMTSDQATAVWNVLKPEVIEGETML